MALTESEASSTPPQPRTCAWRRWALIVGIAAALVVVFTLFDVRALLSSTLETIENLGVWGPVLFVVIYILASWVGMLPATVMYVYLGSLAGPAGREKSPAEWVLYAVGLIATIVVTIFITKIAKRVLAKRTGQAVE